MKIWDSVYIYGLGTIYTVCRYLQTGVEFQFQIYHGPVLQIKAKIQAQSERLVLTIFVMFLLWQKIEEICNRKSAFVFQVVDTLVDTLLTPTTIFAEFYYLFKINIISKLLPKQDKKS